jgi:hypothetical protein
MVVRDRHERRAGLVIEGRFVQARAMPANKGMKLTGQSGAVLEKRRARPAPLWPAAYPSLGGRER